MGIALSQDALSDLPGLVARPAYDRSRLTTGIVHFGVGGFHRAHEAWYLDEMRSFQGIKPPYVGPDVDAVHWMLYVVHLGKRFTASACDQVIEDLAEEDIEAARYCQPLHQQFHYQQPGAAEGGARRGQFPLTERIADRAIALPFHAGLTADHVKFIVKTMKDASVNVGAGAAIY